MSGAVQLDSSSGERTRVRLRVKPAGRRDRIVGPHGGALKLEVRAAPEKGRANTAVVALLADVLDLPTDAVRLVAGETSQDKLVELDLPARELAGRLRGVGIASSPSESC